MPAIAPVLSVDLRSGNPAASSAPGVAGPAIRYVVLEQLGQTLRRLLTLLRQGHAPAALGLGEDVRQPGCERLLTLLYIQWCGSGMNPLPSQREHGEELRPFGIDVEAIPRPAGVPLLPETLPAGLTERQLIELHSSVASCAKCHVKIDPYGFALEQYDAIGRRRSAELDTKAALPDGRTIEGLAGLRDYLAGPRQAAFVRQFCKKLLGYALGRSVQLSDELLLAEMQSQLAAHDYRVDVIMETIVRSRQFREIRGRDVAFEE